MVTMTDPTFDLACAPGAIAPCERVSHFVLGYRLFAKLAKERIDLSSGIALRLDADNISEVARFVANERKCCHGKCRHCDLSHCSSPLIGFSAAQEQVPDRGASTPKGTWPYRLFTGTENEKRSRGRQGCVSHTTSPAPSAAER